MTHKAQTGISKKERELEAKSLKIISVVAVSMALIVAGAVSLIILSMINNDGEDPISPMIPIVQQSQNSDQYIYMTTQELNAQVDGSSDNARLLRSEDELLQYISELAPLDYLGISRITGSKPDFEQNDYLAFLKYKDLYLNSNYRITNIVTERNSVSFEMLFDRTCNSEYRDMTRYDVYLLPIEKNAVADSAKITINYEIDKKSFGCGE